LPSKPERERLNLNLVCNDPFKGVGNGVPQGGVDEAAHFQARGSKHPLLHAGVACQAP